MSVGYAVAYRLGIRPWERAGAAAEASFNALLDREEAERPKPPGRALDLGCGRGQHTLELANRGWDAVGVDNVPRALQDARAAARPGLRFVEGDVTALDASTLGTFDFFLDVGCFHGLSRDQQRAEARGVTALANPGATLLMLAFTANGLPLLPSGVSSDDIAAAYAGWAIESVEPADTSGMPKPLRLTAPQWYRLRLK
jgi:SAM-dependent methyltransferase